MSSNKFKLLRRNKTTHLSEEESKIRRVAEGKNKSRNSTGKNT